MKKVILKTTIRKVPKKESYRKNLKIMTLIEKINLLIIYRPAMKFHSIQLHPSLDEYLKKFIENMFSFPIQLDIFNDIKLSHKGFNNYLIVKDKSIKICLNSCMCKDSYCIIFNDEHTRNYLYSKRQMFQQ